MKNILLVIAATFFMLSCNTDRNNRDRDRMDDRDTLVDGIDDFHKKHIGDLHNAMDLMHKDFGGMAFSGDVDYDFALVMKRHHQGAMDMAKCVLDHGTDTRMKDLAARINERQLKEVQEFDLIIQHYNNAKGDSGFGRRAGGMITPMSGISHGNILDQAYASMMVQHHRDAIRISEEYMKTGKHPKMKEIATRIINTNPDEIRELEGLK